MSYCRWGQDGSYVYVYGTDYVDRDNKGRVVRVWVCMHANDGDDGDEGSFCARSEQEMLDHLLEHRARGEIVPESALERLREEMAEH